MRYFKKPLPKFSEVEVWQELKKQCYDGTIEYEDFPADEYKYFDRLRITYLKYMPFLRLLSFKHSQLC